MKKLFLLILFVIGTLQGSAYAQSFDQVVQKFENKKGAEVMYVPGALMKMIFAFTDKDDSLNAKGKEFIRRITSMTVLDMAECSSADKEAFATAMRSVQIDDFDPIDMQGLDTARLFFRKGEKKNEMIMAVYNGESYSLTHMKGSFDEEMAQVYAEGSSKPKKQE